MTNEHPAGNATPPAVAPEWLLGTGEMADRIRALDWAQTSLGPRALWPNELREATKMCLESSHPIVMYWGPDYNLIYNDAWRPIIGGKHPSALGRRGREVWAEIWNVFGVMLDDVSGTGVATWWEDQLLLLHRFGFTEESYFSYSLSPVRDDAWSVRGVLTAVTETTRKVIGERRLRTLRDLSARAAEGTSADATCELSGQVLRDNAHDFPFFALYLADGPGGAARLAAASGVTPGGLSAPSSIVPGDGAPWPLEAARAGLVEVDLGALPAGLGPWPGGPWPEPARRAVVVPLAGAGEHGPYGYLVTGLSPRRPFDADYADFLRLATGPIATALRNVRTLDEERRRATELAELDRQKTEFFNNVSHEFRTPLTLLLGPLDDALHDAGGPLPAHQRERIELAQRSAGRLLKLVNMLLDFSRFEAGRADVAFEPIDLGPYTADLASAFRAAVEKAGLRFVVDCPSLPELAYVDRGAWEKIVLNLLSNALKHTFEGAISLTLRAEGDQAVLVVHDTGIGIPPGELPHLFERFHRVRGARSRSVEGTGIGLALTQELVKLHGGQVGVESEVGRGTTFTVTLPVGAAHLPSGRRSVAREAPAPAASARAYVDEAFGWLGEQAAPTAALAAGVKGERRASAVAVPDGRAGATSARVLLADDNTDMREYIARLLRQRGDEVEAVADGLEALAAARTRPPDLVLSDVMMPGLDGFALLRELRADPATRAVPVILLSARAGEEARVEGLDAGADDYLVKPFAARELLARVGGALALARLRSEIGRERERLIAQLERSNQELDQFAYVASHDLKAPLRAIANLSQWLEEDLGDRMTDEERAQMALLRGRVSRLEGLIDGILSYSRAGRVRDKDVAVDTSALLAEVVELLAPAKPAEVVVAPGLPVVTAERVPLQQVFLNLVSNALKYAGRPDARVEVRARDAGAHWEFAVADNGPGIDPAYHHRIWGIFQTLEARDRVEGTGIGLSVVQKIVETRGGRAWVDSAEGRGATFFFTWPKHPREAP